MKKDRIFAILARPNGRGQFRCWQAFAFDTQVQSHVENYMLYHHHGDYFLVMESQLERGSEFPHHYYLTSKKYGRHWLSLTEIKIRFYLKRGRRFGGYKFLTIIKPI